MQLSPKLDVQRWALEAERSKSVNPVGKGLGRSIVSGRMRQIIQKNVTILGLPRVTSVLHLVYPHGQPRYYLLLTGIHRFLAPLFTSIRTLFGTSTLPHRHDSTQTWNSARFAK
jgi:hypothetical protein